MMHYKLHFNIAPASSVLTIDGSQVTSMARVSLYQKEKIRKHIADRHYYLKQAHQSIKLKQIGEMHNFCSLAEKEQESLDVFAAWLGTQNIIR